jgi:lysyl-tRNA synthetase, class I
MAPKTSHWADVNADKIIREKGDKSLYTCASGITPSGTVHIGNFREIISTELVARALRDRGKSVRFIYSWDDFDVFRKVPKNMPDPDTLETFLRKSITEVPDPYGVEESYARANEAAVEKVLPLVGIVPEYIYQAKEYGASKYSAEIRTALEAEPRIRAILNEHRTSPLPAEWKPVSVFCGSCGRDTTEVESWDGDWSISYSCSSCGNREMLDLRSASGVKLPWRIDWPMRWWKEGVDFEPAGKDHHSEGGSFDTAEKIVKAVYDGSAPVSFQYDFVRIKGRGGKISSSSGEVVSLPDVLEIYTPEVVRFLFAGTRPNAEFAISFDLDVLKIYEDYDKCERTYFNKPESEKAIKKWEKQARIYELSQVDAPPAKMPYQIPIRHLTNLLQTYNGDIDQTIAALPDVEEHQLAALKKRAGCAWNWICKYSPEEFRFALREPGAPPAVVGESESAALAALAAEVGKLGAHDEVSLSEAFYRIAEETGLSPAELFACIYRVLIGKEKGPRLAAFILSAGQERILPLVQGYKENNA